MNRTLLRSPAFARDLRNWLKSHPDAAASIESAVQQMSVDTAGRHERIVCVQLAVAAAVDKARHDESLTA